MEGAGRTGLSCPSCVLEWGLQDAADDPSTILAAANPGASAASPTPAKASGTISASSPGRLAYFGDYELIEEVARGGMGIVYRARQVSLNRIVAVKMVLAGRFAAAETMQRFRAEAEAAARLRHPNIVGIHEVGEHDGFHYFSMDFIEGKHLGQILRERPVSPRQAAEWVRTVASAIHYAHGQGILHRDIKPSNILLDLEGRPHVSDFGLAKQIEGDSDLTVSGQVLGSPNYMPPEQAEGHAGKSAVTSDIYSLGAVLYHLLTGRPPFVAQSVPETLRMVIQGEVLRPILLNPSVPVDLETICLKSLEREPSRRYATALELADELGRFLRDEPIRARPISRPARVMRWCRRNPVVSSLTGGLALAVCLGLAGVLWQLRRVQASRENVQREVAKGHVSNGIQLLQDGDWFKSLLWFTEALKSDPPTPETAEPHRHRIASIFDACPRLLHVLTHDEQAIAHAAVSPTEDKVATVSLDYTARIWDIHTGRVLMQTERLPELPASTVFSPDGRNLAVVLNNNTVHILDISTGKLRFAPIPHRNSSRPGTLLPPVFDASGKWLATQSDTNVVQVWDLATGQRLGEPLRHDARIESFDFLAGRSLLVVRTESGNRFWEVASSKAASAFGEAHERMGKIVPSPEPGTFFADGKVHRLIALPGSEEQRVESRTLAGTFEGDTSIRQAVFSPNGERLLTILNSGTARLWDSATGEALGIVLAPGSPIEAGAFSPDGRKLILVAQDNAATVWDPEHGESLAPPIIHSRSDGEAAFSASGRFLLTVHPSFAGCLWDLGKAHEPPALLRAEAAQQSPAADPRSGFASVRVSREANSLIRVQDPLSGLDAPLHPLSLKSKPRVVRLDVTARYVILEGEQSRAQVWDAISGFPLTPLVASRFAMESYAANKVTLRASSAPAEVLTALAEASSGNRLDGKGGWTVLSLEELLAAWGKAGAAISGPSEGTAPRIDLAAWHRSEAEKAEADLDWLAAVFHRARVEVFTPGVAEIQARLEYARTAEANARQRGASYRERRQVLPPRLPGSSDRFIDLSGHATNSVLGSRSGRVPEIDSPVGVRELTGTKFYLRGAIGLFGKGAAAVGEIWPTRVNGIRVGQRCDKLHFLHTTYWGGSEPAPVASIHVRYAGGLMEEIGITNMVHIANDWPTEPFKPSQAELAWLGTYRDRSRGTPCIRFFKYTWINPHPAQEIVSIGLISAGGQASYNLLALTAE